MRHASLFSGIGGFDLAAKWMGWENVMQCEIDPFCQSVLRHHFPSTTLYGDIRTINGNDWRGKVDILTGGFPCQPFSAAGRRRGTEDDRYLWPEMLRVIREIQPTWIVAENVDGITSMVQYESGSEVEEKEYTSEEDARIALDEMRRNGRARRSGQGVLETIMDDIEKAGYEVTIFSIPACAIGAPHIRKRCWFVAHAKGQRGGDLYRDIQKKNERSSQQFSEFAGTNQQSTSNSTSQGLERQSFEEPAFGRCEQIHWEGEWTQAATRLCRVDDGVPRGLDGITVQKWRRGSLKAYGNAIVPQVAFRIFQAISHA